MIPVFEDWRDVPAPWKGGAVALGNFDGVHRGHQALIVRTAEQARALDAPVVVLTFEPHPRRFFVRDTGPFRLTLLPAKVHESLEGELAAANARIAELEGKRSQALVLAGSKDLAPSGKATTAAAKWFGAPLRLELARTWDKEFPIEKLEELVDLLRDLTGDHGRAELLKTSLSWSSTSSPEKGIGPFINVRVTVRNGTTKLEVTDRLGQLAGIWFGAIGGGVGGGTMALPILAGIATMPALVPVFLAGWFGSFYAATRKLFKRGAGKRAEKLQTLFESVEAEITKAVGSGS